MKKILISALVTVGLFAFGLQGYSQVSFGVKTGLNVNNISQDFANSDMEYDTKMKAGFHFGPAVNIGFTDQLGLQTGLIFTSKGFSMDLDEWSNDDFDVDGYFRFRFNYLEIPLSVAFNIEGFQVYAGPYVAIGIGGTAVEKYEVKFEGTTFYEEDDSFNLKPVFGDYDPADLDEDEDAFNALDFGLNFGLGYKVGPVLLNAGYSLGLGNMTPGIKDSDFDPDDRKMSNRVITVSASFYF